MDTRAGEMTQDEFYDRILREKYCKGSERTLDDVFARVARGLAQAEGHEAAAWQPVFRAALDAGFIPAGRILSACGTGIRATLINCFVQPVGDAISKNRRGKASIYRALLEAAETMRRGGGVGFDFSRIRPRGALVRTTRSHASGPLSYMRVFDRSCETVESAGARRGAQMGILRCDHPDIEDFIVAKDLSRHNALIDRLELAAEEAEDLRRRLRTLSNFNISVAITDDFLRAARADREFPLVHAAEPAEELKAAGAHRRADGLWVYRTVRARALFDRIIRQAYDTAEPGVVFIDRMNRENNLSYCERIEATNPCGEQPLPDYGCCCLGSINLSRFVVDPFGRRARFDGEAFAAVAATAVRMLDDVLDVTYWPLPAQAREARAKRRIGLGFTGLGTALAMLGIAYGSDAGTRFAARVARTMRDAAYRASVALAREKGAFPMFRKAAYLRGPFARRLPEDIRRAIARHGIRNSHLLSIAPTGTISLAIGRNVTGGIEPAYAWTYRRVQRRPDGTLQACRVEDFAYREYLRRGGDPLALPACFVNAQMLTARQHLRMQAAVQPFVDSSISKTINVPPDYPFEDFRDLYFEAWKSGCKGCTAYRPNLSVGAVLTADVAEPVSSDPDPGCDWNPGRAPGVC